MSVDLAPPRTAVFAPTARPGRSRVSGHHRSRAVELTGLVSEALSVRAEDLMPGTPQLEVTPDRVATLARSCVSEARADAETDAARARDLYLLALDLQVLALDLQQEELVLRNRRLGECADSLARLRGIPNSQDLVDAVCQELVSRCDFGRATISRVDQGMWLPRKAYFAAADASWFDDWIDQAIPLHGHTPEARLLTERRPALVLDTTTAPVHRDIIVESGQSQSYVVAPLISRGTVVGFFHCDHFPTQRRASDVDRDVLGAFAEGLARLHERLVLMERIDAQRAEVGSVLENAVRSLPEALGAVPRPREITPARLRVLAELTAREVEVLDLVVGGATNRAIASRLVIAEDTVKSHVKQILRKLGVTNRAQAIARAAGTAPD
ncbi:GAF domain-containing protein [Nocardioides immobilis]|uniref:GAF domain-containing protein n=1 Tax=Nocardioides immobilis TaxID=2049295 RepID=A0A417Y7R0_9ACTN|nr:LuxR C-terminal-related transcriptional regulator [Nocardioides immobilis]RHW28506.1 GAF domain-containing protein [Nocardioides immobilis]